MIIPNFKECKRHLCKPRGEHSHVKIYILLHKRQFCQFFFVWLNRINVVGSLVGVTEHQIFFSPLFCFALIGSILSLSTLISAYAVKRARATGKPLFSF